MGEVGEGKRSNNTNKDVVFITENSEFDKNEENRLTYVALRKIFSEIYKRDEEICPDWSKFSDNFSDNIIKESLKNTFKNRSKSKDQNNSLKILSQTKLFPFYNTLFDPNAKLPSHNDDLNLVKFKKSNLNESEINVIAFPSKISSQVDRLELYSEKLKSSINGYLVVMERPENAHFIQEARAHVLSRGGFYDRQDDFMPKSFTFSPCPHDKPCPLQSPCTTKTKFSKTDKNLLNFGGRNILQPTSLEFSYVVFSVGQNRSEKLIKTFKKEKEYQIKKGGIQYAQVLSDSKKLKGLLPYPRLLSKNYSDRNSRVFNEIRNVSICLPDGDWFYSEKVLYAGKRRGVKEEELVEESDGLSYSDQVREISGAKSEIEEVKIDGGLFTLIKMSDVGSRLPIFNFKTFLKKYNF